VVNFCIHAAFFWSVSYCGVWLLTFQRHLLPPSSGQYCGTAFLWSVDDYQSDCVVSWYISKQIAL
jgi:hypothetical protein